MRAILSGLALFYFSSASVIAQTTPEEAWKKFRAGCIHCHQPPEMSLPGGQAFADQLHRTA